MTNAGGKHLFGLGKATCPKGACTAVIGSDDDGATWTTRASFTTLTSPGPLATPAAPNQLVGIRFADPETGFVYGSATMRTVDGGRSWKPMDVGGRTVLSLETDGSTVWMVTAAKCQRADSGSARGCSGLDVRSLDVTASAPQQTQSLKVSQPVESAWLSMDGADAYVSVSYLDQTTHTPPRRVSGKPMTLVRPQGCQEAGGLWVWGTANRKGGLVAVCQIGDAHASYGVATSTDRGATWSDARIARGLGSTQPTGVWLTAVDLDRFVAVSQGLPTSALSPAALPPSWPAATAAGPGPVRRPRPAAPPSGSERPEGAWSTPSAVGRSYWVSHDSGATFEQRPAPQVDQPVRGGGSAGPGTTGRDMLSAMSEAPALPAGYPAQWEADVVLRDGSVAHLRPITPSDVDAVHRFHAGQSDESIYMRFFAPLRQLSDRDVTRFTNVDYHDRVALVATVRGDIIGIGRYDRITPTSAEVAFNISDRYQGKGIGSVLLEHLAVIAWESGVEEFTAEVLPQNRKMISVFSDAGYEVSRHFEDGVVSLTFQIQPTERSEAVRLSREHRAESVSMHSVLFPDSIAVVGASRRPESIGHHILSNILAAGFNGAVHAVNREAMEVLGLPAHARVSDIPDEVDLAVVAVPGRGGPRRRGRLCRGGGQDAARRQRRLRRVRARRRRTSSPSCSPPRGSPGCGCSARTRSASSTTTQQCGSTPRWRPSCRHRDGWACSPRAGPWASRCSRRPPAAASASPSSPPPATGSTSRATTSCSTGSTTTAPTRSASTSSRWATPASSPASPGGSPRPSRSSS